LVEDSTVISEVVGVLDLTILGVNVLGLLQTPYSLLSSLYDFYSLGPVRPSEGLVILEDRIFNVRSDFSNLQNILLNTEGAFNSIYNLSSR
jgi:hypothetical protein